MQCSSVGYGKTRPDVMKIAEKVAKEKPTKSQSDNPRLVAKIFGETQ